jgi:hypothetical protein
MAAGAEAVDRPDPRDDEVAPAGRENLGAADLELTDDDLREIEEAQLAAQGHRYAEANERMIDR